MTLQHLRDLVAVVSHGGFRAAARALDVSQAGLTKGVSVLEKECGGALIQRTASGIALTALGEAFLPYARATLFEADRTQEWLRHRSVGGVSSVAIGVSPDPSLALVPEVISDFRGTRPDIGIRVFEASASELMAALRDGRIDLAVMRLPSDAEAGDLRIDSLYESEAAVVARSGHPRAGASSVADLGGVEWVVVGDPCIPAHDDACMRELFTRHQLAPPPLAVVSNSLFGTLSRLLASDAVARLPKAILGHPLAAQALCQIGVREQVGLTYEVVLASKGRRRWSREVHMLASMLGSFAKIGRALGGFPAAPRSMLRVA